MSARCTHTPATRARADLELRPFFHNLSASEQERYVADLARRIVLTESLVGRLAARCAHLAAEMANAFERFLAAYPTEQAATEAARDALSAAGLGESPEYNAEYYASTPETFRGLLAMTELMFTALDHCDPPELLPRGDPEVA